ncbi:MAG: hypothetical protein BGO01_12630 [Armatimonadetes bacterium 55-13]|nr:MAG: hypothetical protein BGO01_12630 [Armatimonadetes bacterium 55-13]
MALVYFDEIFSGPGLHLKGGDLGQIGHQRVARLNASAACGGGTRGTSERVLPQMTKDFVPIAKRWTIRSLAVNRLDLS